MLPERVDRVEQKLDFLSVSVITRFNDVSHALAEQRQYTEFAFGQLDRRIASLEAKFEGRFAGLDQRITGLEAKFDDRLASLEAKFDDRLAGLEAKFDGRIAGLDQRITAVEERLTRLEERMTVLEELIAGMDAKLDRLLERHTTSRPARSRKKH